MESLGPDPPLLIQLPASIPGKAVEDKCLGPCTYGGDPTEPQASARPYHGCCDDPGK